MKVLMLAGILFAAGCGTYVPMEELEHRAMLTGDWAAVEKRERMAARRRAKQGPSCPNGLVAYCVRYVGDTRCQCVSSASVRNALAGLY